MRQDVTVSSLLPQHVDLGGFRLVSNLGSGGMGSVYLARYLGDCLVAVKLVRLDGQGPNARELADRFDRECRILMELRHPAIVSAYTHGVLPDRGSRYLVMEFVAGRTLSQIRAENGGPLSPVQAAELLLPIVDALCYCHARRVFHRDITPRNILVTDGPADGAAHARLVDFGASWWDDDERLTRGVVFGNIDFQPLERFQTDALSMSPIEMGTTSDVYGIAAVALYLTGGEGTEGHLLTTEQKIGSTPIEAADPKWGALLSRALHARRVERTPDMATFQQDLRRYLAERTLGEEGPPALEPVPPFWDVAAGEEASEGPSDASVLEPGQLEKLQSIDSIRPSDDWGTPSIPVWLAVATGVLTSVAFVMGWLWHTA
jgi:serine/threonine-protein kinase